MSVAGMSTRRERSEEEARALFDEYLVTTRLRVQNIYDIPLSPSARAKVQNVKEQLILFQKKIRDSDVLSLKNYILQDHPFMVKLHLNYNKITAAGGRILAYLLEKDRTNLRELYLNKNTLKDDGVVAIAKALETNTRLQQLKISNNAVHDKGAFAVAEMLTKNDTLRGLEFDHNEYGKVALGALADSLNKNTGIIVFQVGESSSIRSRLQFVKMLIDTENPENPRTGAVLCFSKDRNNETLDEILKEWRQCKKEGKKLINLPREMLQKFQKFNRYNESELADVHSLVKTFLEEARKSGIQNVRQGKILMMGRAGAGKTSLTRSLISGRSLLTGEGPDRATVSVEIRPWTIDQVKCSIWDFGGQEEYYMTHSFFVTPRCIVVVCVNLGEYQATGEHFNEHIQYYIDSIQCHAPGAKFVIVMTQADRVTEEEAEVKKRHVQTMFDKIERQRVESLEAEIKKLEPDAELDTLTQKQLMESDNNQEEEQTESDVIRSHRLTETKNLEEIRIDNKGSATGKPNAQGPSNLKRNAKLQKKIRNNGSFHNAFMENISSKKNAALVTRGSIVLNEALDVEVEPSSTRQIADNVGHILNQNKAPSSRLGKLLRRDPFDDLPTKKDPREKLKEETLAKLNERRIYRPFLIAVLTVSAADEGKNVDRLEQTLQKIIMKTEDYDIGVDLPKKYALLYQKLTGQPVHYNGIDEPRETKNYTPGGITSMALRRLKPLIGRKESRNSVPDVAYRTDGFEDEEEVELNPQAAMNNRKRGTFFGNAKRKSNASAASAEQADEKDGTGRFGAIFNSRFKNGAKFKPIVQINDLYKQFLSSPDILNIASKNKNKMLLTSSSTKFDSPDELHKALQVLHALGYILWFEENEVLRDIVFVDPQWVVDMIKSVVRHNMFEDGEGSLGTIRQPTEMTAEEFQKSKDQFREDATLDTRLLFQFPIWSSATQMERFHMLSLMESFDLLCERPRKADRDRYAKFFIPLYLKGSFAHAEDNMLRMTKLEQEIINNIETVPKFAKSLFVPTEGMTESQAQFPGQRHSRTFFEEDLIRPKNIQWRYEFKNFFPEGLFLRLLVRCHPFVKFHPLYKPTERFMVGTAALGVTFFLQAERKEATSESDEEDSEQKTPAGALILTAIQEVVTQSNSFKYNMNDIWQAFSLFAFEIEDLLSTFVGLETHVFVSFVHEDIGKVIIPRENLEVHEVTTNSDPTQKVRRINIIIGAERIPLHYLIPPLYILPKTLPNDVDRSDVKYTTPELVRMSRVARIEYGLLLVEAQLGEEKAGDRERIQILHKQLVKYADHLLTQLCETLKAAQGKIIRGFDQSMVFLKEQNLESVVKLEPEIMKLRTMQQSSFLYANNYLGPTHIQEGIQLCWELFAILEKKLVIKEHEPSRRRKGLFF